MLIVKRVVRGCDGAHGRLEDFLALACWFWGVVHCCGGSVVEGKLVWWLGWRVVDLVGVVGCWV